MFRKVIPCALGCLLLVSGTGAEIALGYQVNDFHVMDWSDEPVKASSFSIGLYRARPLHESVDSISKLLVLAGKVEYSVIRYASNQRTGVASTYSADASVLLQPVEFLRTGPGFGILGLMHDSRRLFSDMALFRSCFLYSVILNLNNSPLSGGYQYLYSGVTDFIPMEFSRHSFYLYIKIPGWNGKDGANR